jgi:hypothetical protein
MWLEKLRICCWDFKSSNVSCTFAFCIEIITKSIKNILINVIKKTKYNVIIEYYAKF